MSLAVSFQALPRDVLLYLWTDILVFTSCACKCDRYRTHPHVQALRGAFNLAKTCKWMHKFFHSEKITHRIFSYFNCYTPLLQKPVSGTRCNYCNYECETEELLITQHRAHHRTCRYCGIGLCKATTIPHARYCSGYLVERFAKGQKMLIPRMVIPLLSPQRMFLKSTPGGLYSVDDKLLDCKCCPATKEAKEILKTIRRGAGKLRKYYIQIFAKQDIHSGDAVIIAATWADPIEAEFAEFYWEIQDLKIDDVPQKGFTSFPLDNGIIFVLSRNLIYGLRCGRIRVEITESGIIRDRYQYHGFSRPLDDLFY